MLNAVPVLYYHRVGAPDPIHLSVPTALFDAQMSFLARHGWKTLTMRELVGHVTGTAPAPDRSVAITFDDGFRDNLTEALPVLRRLGFRATVFATATVVRPDIVPPAPQMRPFTEAQKAAHAGEAGDFLSESEFDELVAGGVDVHSHGWNHAQVFREPRITGFYPDDDDHWAIPTAWPDRPKLKQLPIFPRSSAFVVNAWKPRTAKFTAADGTFFQGQLLDTGWFDIETDEERRARIREEFVRSRAYFARWHEPGCDVFCWPWGAHDDVSRAEAASAGYAAALATSTGANLPGCDPFAINRFPVKKPGLFRFAVGLLLRGHPVLSRLYSQIRGRF
ncbi:MAG TPA: polysaccharide deacetylase family protein [Candidatus Ozemobacteraceae bacterium]|nr:polysaccharide deacetylase family protein [Candidatus Ozemobacteraceae bacterium]